jgi:hypothetical protein
MNGVLFGIELVIPNLAQNLKIKLNKSLLFKNKTLYLNNIFKAIDFFRCFEFLFKVHIILRKN